MLALQSVVQKIYVIQIKFLNKNDQELAVATFGLPAQLSSERYGLECHLEHSAFHIR